VFAGPRKKVHSPKLHGPKFIPPPRNQPLDTKRVDWNPKESHWLRNTIVLLSMGLGAAIGYWFVRDLF
jgi:hypothetical protein